ncbi:MAG: glycosyltransferase [Ruminococcaceae bacterium]|nr:glycosyltransferase [Oscillospiraceae bacterium]
MKILLLTDRMESGGVETHVAQLAREFRAIGHEVTLWTSGGRIADQLRGEGFRCLLQPPPSKNPFRLLLQLIKLMRFIKREKPEVLHAHTRLTAQLIRYAKKRGCAEIVTVHARFLTNPFLSRAAYWGERTIAVSEDLRGYVTAAYRLPPERVRVIPNGIDLRRFSPVGRASPDASILFASRLDDDCARGAELLCLLAPALCKAFPTLQIGIAGGGNAYQRISRLAEKANQAVGHRALVMHGQVNDMPSLFRSYRILVGVSRVAIEAAACGCAVVLCGNEGYLGIWNASNAQEASISNFCARGSRLPSGELLLRDLSRLLSSPVLCERAAAESRDFAVRHLDSESMARETLGVYRQALPQKQRYRIMVGGYFGCKNLGDDAILQGFLHGLQQIHPNLAVTALSGNPHYDRKRTGIRTIHRKNPFSVAWNLRRTDLFILGGGSLLQNRTGKASLSYYLWLLRTARILGCRTALFASGIGPIFGSRAKRAVVRALCRCDRIGLRDGDSVRLLQSLGIPKELLFQGADAAFLLPPPPSSRTAFLLRELGIAPSVGFLGVVLHGNGNARELRCHVLDAVRMLCLRHHLAPLFLVFDELHDTHCSQKAAHDCREPSASCTVLRTPSDAVALLSACRAVISMRLHGMILSCLAGTPALGIGSDPEDRKLSAFAKEAAVRYLPPNGLYAPLIVAAAEPLLNESAADRQRRTDARSEMQKKAQKDLANTLEIVYNKR